MPSREASYNSKDGGQKPASSHGAREVHLSDLPFLDSLSLPNAPAIDQSKLQPVEVTLMKHNYLIKVCSVGQLACKLARFFIFGEDVLIYAFE